MVAKAHNAIQKAQGKVFDALRNNVFFDSTDSLTMLKVSETVDEFEDIINIDGQWFFEKDKDNNLVLQIAKSFEDLTDSMEEATHFRVNNDVYTISDGDIKPPMGTSIVWEMKGERYQSQSGYSVLR